jgi:hypothetical protein
MWKHDKLVGWVVMRTGVEIYVSMGMFSVYLAVPEEAGDHRRQWRTLGPSKGLYIDTAKAEVGEGLDLTKDLQDSLLKMLI